MNARSRPRRPQHAFTLIEIAVVLVIIAIFVAMGAVMFRGISAAQKRSLTATRLATIDAAIVQFVTLNKRMPCPAFGTIASGGGNAGVEQRAAGACTNNQQAGVVPWVTLGLTETDVTDGWDRRITYRTDGDLVADNAMDLSWCDPAGTTAGLVGGVCNSACTAATVVANCTPPLTYLAGKGLEVRNVAGTTLMIAPNTGAAYVIISHGESGGGAYLNSGVLFSSTTTDGTEEQKNYASLALQAYYVDDATTDVGGASHFDDILSRPSVLSVANKAGLGPRSHN